MSISAPTVSPATLATLTLLSPALAPATRPVVGAAEGPSFPSIVVELEVDIDGNTERFDEALEDARRSCLVQNALRVPVVVETEVHTPCIPAPIDDTFALPAYPQSGM